MSIFLIFIFVSLAVICVASSGNDDRKSNSLIGFGAQRLRKFRSRLNQGAANSCDGIEEYRFADAVVDNFAPTNSQVKWAHGGQRYWINKQLWGGPGFPIFVFIGGEGAESCTRLTNKMDIYNLALQHRGLLLDVEHRFYGESYPTEDMSTANLKYLSSSQALADLARIIDYVKTSLNTKSSKVITVGGSYPGNLAAWFRLKYPSVTQGSIASSAPVTAKVDFYEYMEVVNDALVYFSGQKCAAAFANAAKTISQLVSEGLESSGATQLQNDFKLCAPMKSSLDLGILYSDLMGNIQGTVQYNNERSGVMNVTDICNAMLNDGSTPYQNFVALTAKFREVNGQVCEDASWSDTISYLSATAYDPTNSARPWVYQTCNEFGYYQTTTSKNQPFRDWKELNLDFSRAMCRDSFNGWNTDPEVEWINEQYGDVHISATNVVFSSGTIDPWHALGVTNTTALAQPSESSAYILGTAHCRDLYAPSPSDSPELVQAREFIYAEVAKYLA